MFPAEQACAPDATQSMPVELCGRGSSCALGCLVNSPTACSGTATVVPSPYQPQRCLHDSDPASERKGLCAHSGATDSLPSEAPLQPTCLAGRTTTQPELPARCGCAMPTSAQPSHRAVEPETQIEATQRRLVPSQSHQHNPGKAHPHVRPLRRHTLPPLCCTHHLNVAAAAPTMHL